jgi:hypothetical protein
LGIATYKYYSGKSRNITRIVRLGSEAGKEIKAQQRAFRARKAEVSAKRKQDGVSDPRTPQTNCPKPVGLAWLAEDLHLRQRPAQILDALRCDLRAIKAQLAQIRQGLEVSQTLIGNLLPAERQFLQAG